MALSGVGGVAAAFHARLEQRLPLSPEAPRAAALSSDGSERADDEEIAIMSSSIKLSVEHEQRCVGRTARLACWVFVYVD
jgi:hypothetical protein